MLKPERVSAHQSLSLSTFKPHSWHTCDLLVGTFQDKIHQIQSVYVSSTRLDLFLNESSWMLKTAPLRSNLRLKTQRTDLQSELSSSQRTTEDLILSLNLSRHTTPADCATNPFIAFDRNLLNPQVPHEGTIKVKFQTHGMDFFETGKRINRNSYITGFVNS